MVSPLAVSNTGWAARSTTRARALLPRGFPIGEDLWRSRHRSVITLLWLHVVGLAIYGTVRGYAGWHLGTELAAVAGITAAAGISKSRDLQSSLGTLGLVACSGLLVHLSGGLIEAHFHFFVIVVVVTLYQSWLPFLLALAFVVVHHGTVGVIDPGSVYNHAAAVNGPWKWAAVHGLFIAGASAAAMVSWKHAEVERSRAERAAVELHERAARAHEAVQLNDTIVQGLVTAKYAHDLGADDQAAEAVERTLTLAKQLVADLMGDDFDLVEPGALRRAAASTIGS